MISALFPKLRKLPLIRSRSLDVPESGSPASDCTETQLPILPLVRTELFSTCPEWDELIRAYLRATPGTPSRLGAVDLDGFLTWLDDYHPRSLAERDLITSLRSWHAVEFLALEKRLASARFTLLWEHSSDKLLLLGHEKHLQAFLNPVHVWASFQSTRLVPRSTPLPAKVLFFLIQSRVQTLVLSQRAELMLKRLTKSPQLASSLLTESHPQERSQDLCALRELALRGVIALA